MPKPSETGAGQQLDNSTFVTLDSGNVGVKAQDLGVRVIAPADDRLGLERQLAAYVLKCRAVIFTRPGPDDRERGRMLHNLFLEYQNVLLRMAEGRGAGAKGRVEDRARVIAWMRAAHDKGYDRAQVLREAAKRGLPESTARDWYKLAIRGN